MNMLVNLSRELTKKTQIYQYLSARLKLLNPQIEILPISTYHVKKSGEVYVTQIKVTDIAVSFKFNDGLIQSRFNDCTNLLLKPTGETVYIDEEQNIFSFEIQNLPVEAQSLKLRVEYLKNIVGKFNEGEGKR